MKSVLAILADLANGVFATVLAAYVTDTEILWWHFVMGLGLAFLPDLDALSELFKRGKVAASDEYAHDHRDGLHYPILFLLVGILIVFISPFFGWLFLFATGLHFLNDFYGTGWGIQLLWPLTNRRYKLLGRRVNYLKRTLTEQGHWDRLPNDEKRLRWLVSWSAEELPEFIVKWGQADWIKVYYLRLNWISGTEYLLFLLALGILIFTLVY